MHDKTQLGGTVTAAGFIPYVRHPGGQFSMPARLALPIMMTATQAKAPQYPMVDAVGGLVYALPGGGSYSAGA